MMMPSTALPTNPFPGMNPYLEERGFWPDVHTTLIVGLRNQLARRLRPEYRVSAEERVYLLTDPDGTGNGSGNGVGSRYRVPDVAVLTGVGASVGAGVGAGAGASNGGTLRFPAPARSPDALAVQLPDTDLLKERYIEVRRVANREVVAVIELLSPTNKTPPDRQGYLTKRAAILSSPTHLVEIDLLRAGRRMPVIGNIPDTHYRILVANARRTAPVADLYAFGIRDAIPDFVLPLAQADEGIAINLNPVINDAYANGGYDLDIDYAQDLQEPPLSDDDRVWLDALLREQGLRGTSD